MGVMDWELTTVSITRACGRDDCCGYTNPATPGLAVTPYRTGWNVTHPSSGLLVTARGVQPVELSLEDAMALAERLATVGDWTRTSQALRNDHDFRFAVRAILTTLAECPAHA